MFILMRYYLAVDVGTSVIKTVMFDERGKIISISTMDVKEISFRDWWIEKDPFEVLGRVKSAIKQAVKSAKKEFREIKAMSLSNEGETTLVWDKLTGKPVYNAISWEDRRTNEICHALSGRDIAKEIRRKTGLRLSSYFSAPKAKWILDEFLKNRSRAKRNNITSLLFGTMDSWLLWNLTKRKLHATDVSTASRTMLFNINKLEWDDELISLFGLDSLEFPEIVENTSILESGIRSNLTEGVEIPIAGLCVDQQASLYGHRCFNRGDAKVTYGTGAFVLVNQGVKPKFSDTLLTTVAWSRNGRVEYAFDGGVYSAGSAIRWLKDIGLIATVEEASDLSFEAEENTSIGRQRVFVVPAFAGLAAPFWNDSMKASIHGLTLATTRNQLVSATLQSIAFLISAIMKQVQREVGKREGRTYENRPLKADGGLSRNEFLMRFQSDLLGIPLLASKSADISAFGVASMAKYALENEDFEIPTGSYQVYSPRSKNYSKYRELEEQWNRIVLDEVRKSEKVFA
jgi:glycerol kinase